MAKTELLSERIDRLRTQAEALQQNPLIAVTQRDATAAMVVELVDVVGILAGAVETLMEKDNAAG